MFLSQFLRFTPPQIKKYTSGVYVVYYAYNPLTSKLERVVQKANKIIKSTSTRRAGMMLLQSYCLELNARLQSGWSPFTVSPMGDQARLVTPLQVALNRFLNEKQSELRADTIRTYKTAINKLCQWFKPDTLCMDVTKLSAIEFMESITDVSARTYNNTLKQCRILFQWLKDRCYTNDNYFADIKCKKTSAKHRQTVEKSVRDCITDYLMANDRPMLLYLHLIYSSLIRPKEIRNLKCSDISIAGKYIRVDGSIAKNHKTRLAPITPAIEQLVNDAGILICNKTWYLFSNGLRPGPKQVSKTIFNRHWSSIKKALHLDGSAIQQYSFRDSGIYDMLKAGIDDLSVMQAADHSSLNITSIYAKHINTSLNEKLYNDAPEF